MLKYFVILLAVFIAGVPVAVAMGGTATLLLIMERGFAALTLPSLHRRAATASTISCCCRSLFSCLPER